MQKSKELHSFGTAVPDANVVKHRVRKAFNTFTKLKKKLKNRDGKALSKVTIYTALIQSDGDVIEACKKLDVENYAAFADWLSTDKSSQELTKFFRDKLVNEAQNVVMRALRGTDEKAALDAAKFVLRTLGKNLGYSESPMINVDMRDASAEDKRAAVMSIFGLQEESQTVLQSAQSALENKEDAVVADAVVEDVQKDVQKEGEKTE